METYQAQDIYGSMKGTALIDNSEKNPTSTTGKKKKRSIKSIVRSPKVNGSPEKVTLGAMESDHEEEYEIPKAVYLNPAPRNLPPLDIHTSLGASSALAASTALPEINQTSKSALPRIQGTKQGVYNLSYSDETTAFAKEASKVLSGGNGVVDSQPTTDNISKKIIYYKVFGIILNRPTMDDSTFADLIEKAELPPDDVGIDAEHPMSTSNEYAFVKINPGAHGIAGYTKTGSYKLVELDTFDNQRPKTTMYFKDGKRRIDFVLAYEEEEDELEKKERRNKFENGVMDTGLELEWEPKEESQDQNTCFVKVHAPWAVLIKYAEIMRMKMPLKEDSKSDDNDGEEKLDNADSCCDSCWSKLKCCVGPCTLDSPFIQDEPNFYTAEFSREKSSFFDIKDKDTFFTKAERSRITYRILSETRFGDGSLELGVTRLISQDVYESAFPLHEGKHTSRDSKLPVNSNMRRLLYWEWARWGRWYKFQPLDAIRSYLGEKVAMYFAFLGFYTQMLSFAAIVGLIVIAYGGITLATGENSRQYLGDKVAIYFAWLGFYTHMLLYPSIVGVIIFFYSLATLSKDANTREVCDIDSPDYVGNAIMCPLCDVDCSYWNLSSSCTAAKFTHLFDNNSTIFFAIFMSLWATLFLEFWKRKQFRLSYEWDLVDYDEESDLVRPEFEAVVKNERLNPITRQNEPYLSNKQKFPRAALSLITVLFWILVIIAAVFAVIVYRLAIKAVFAVSVDLSQVQEVELIGQFATPQMLTTITASCLSLVVIMILNKIYEYVALWLTHMELPRTQIEFDDSFTFKMFCFQFVNYYSYLFYVAFLKTTVAGYPSNYTYLGDWRWEQCDPGGCMYELSIQLIIIMLGKQIWNNCLEIVMPWALNKYNQYRSTKTTREMPDNEYTRWEQDYDLQQATEMGLFYEYLEMVIQFGFVTLFVAAFPLAPLFALLNNVIEIRLDANKFICELRRPLSQKCADIGAWFYLLEFMGTVSVVTNSLTIAITSDLLPKMVYYYVYSQAPYGSSAENTMTGYTNDSLSYFNTSDFANRSKPSNMDPFGTGNVTICRYRDYRSPPTAVPKYELTMQYWHVVAARLAFVIVMEHVVFFLKKFLDYVIPDRPKKLQDLIKREHFLVKDMLVKAEAEKIYRQVVENVNETTGKPRPKGVVDENKMAREPRSPERVANEIEMVGKPQSSSLNFSLDTPTSTTGTPI